MDKKKIDKIANALECCKDKTKGHCNNCDYRDGVLCGIGECTADLALDVIDFIEEQEAVEAPLDAFGHPYCPKCKVLVYQTWHYCPHCGQAVK